MYVLTDRDFEKDVDSYHITEFNNYDYLKQRIFYRTFSLSNQQSEEALRFLKKYENLILILSYRISNYTLFNKNKRKSTVVYFNTAFGDLTNAYYYISEIAFEKSPINGVESMMIYYYDIEDFIFKHDVNSFFRQKSIDKILKELD